jgi:hypothetical protein
MFRFDHAKKNYKKRSIHAFYNIQYSFRKTNRKSLLVTPGVVLGVVQDTVNRFYQLLRLDYISTANQRIKSCPTSVGQINLPQLLIKPLELKCGAFGSFNRELTKLFFDKTNLRKFLDNAVN